MSVKYFSGDKIKKLMHPDNISPKIQNGSSAHFFENILNDGIDMVLLMDADGMVIFHSNNIPEAFGYDLKDILNRNIFDFIHPRDLTRAKMTMSRAISNPDHPIFIEVRAKTKFKACIWVDVKVINRLNKPGVNGIVCSLRIIQTEKETKLELQRREAFYRKLIEEGEEIIYLLDKDKKMHFLGENIYRALGYTPKELEGKDNFHLVHPEERDEMIKTFNNALAKPGVPYTTQYRIKHKTGNYSWREGTIINKLHDPVINALVLYTRDISDRKIAEEKMNLQKLFFEDILNQLPFPLAILDDESRFIYANLHYTNEDPALQNWIIGKTKTEFLHKIKLNKTLIQKRIKLFFKTVKEKKNYDWKDQIIDRNGEIKYTMHQYCHIGKDAEGRELFLSYDIDITEIQKAEQSLRESELLFRSTFEQAAVGIVNLDMDGKWIRMNNRFCEMLDYSREELNDLTFKEITHEDDIAIDAENRKKLREGEFESCSFEKRYIKKDGQAFWANLTLSSIKKENGKPKYFIGIIQDINDKKKTEASLRSKNEELNTFIYRASHDLRGPIASLLGLAKLAQHELKDELALNIMSKVSHTAEHLDEILTSLIDITQLQDGKISMKKINFMEVTKGILQTLENISGTSMITIKPEIEPMKDFYSDKSSVRSILQNLIENAIKYSKQGVHNAMVEIDIKPAFKGVEIVVKDNGIGIREEIQKKVFDIFYRGTSSAKGSGLGLYIVKSAVEKLGGSISLESEENKGSAFKVYLPSMK